MTEGGRAAQRPGPQCFLAFDFGTRRVGVASGNTLLEHATALTTVNATGDERWRQIASLVAEHRPDALIVGIPYHPDGAAHDNTRRARAFGRQLHGRFKRPVHEVDERYSTTEALGFGARDADAAAAALLLEQYLRTLATSTAPTTPGDDDAAT